MFRIKTDIRQYKCETKDKVEKLIRNWVIRPSDLIYDADGKEWAPIGAHPAFVGLFGILDEQEKNTPDTVVTARSSVSNNTATPDEVTRLTGRPLASDSEADVRETDVFDEEEVAQSLEKFDEERESKESEPEESESEESSEPVPPQAPEGVELPTNDGEVTMMTERTLQMLKITDEDDAVSADPEEEDAASDKDSDASAEVTHVRAEEKVEVTNVRAEEKAEVTNVREEEPEEVTSVRALEPEEEEREDADADEDEDEDEVSEPEIVEEESAPEEEPKKSAMESGPKLGRHDLPEELFATNEISSPEVQEHLKRLDELGELEPSAPADDDDESDSSGEWPSGRLDADSAVDEAWDLVAEDLRTTEEIDADKHDQLVKDSSDPDDDDLPDEYDDLPDDFDEDDEEELPELEAIPLSAEDFVSDGYKIPLPYAIGPTEDDIRRGMPTGRVSESKKNRTFPVPEPKKLNEIHRREFALIKPPPRDHTWVILAVVVVLLFAISVGVANC